MLKRLNRMRPSKISMDTKFDKGCVTQEIENLRYSLIHFLAIRFHCLPTHDNEFLSEAYISTIRHLASKIDPGPDVDIDQNPHFLDPFYM